ncbi:CAAX prenyl protease-like protein [Chthoniobacter flavus]|nr:CPBP family intramembrane glutamic endopeptidase [Chthoniobacter flavus]TCO94010.1 CAAX prenyl protease-like protein [Chthoniobacter flavus]
MKDIAKIFAYLVAVIVLGALLAPPLYWGAQWLIGHGVLTSLAAFKFQKYFDRACMIAALALLWPTVKSLQVKGWRDLGLEPDARWGRHLVIGFVIAALAVGAMATAYIQFRVYRFRPDHPWQKLPMIALSAATVAVLEEALFRGGILGLVRRSLSPYAALFWVSTLFAIVHFLKPDESFDPHPINWLSGFTLIPHAFHQFAEPQTLLASFTTLFMLGWLCGDARLRTRSLWMGIGLHAGIVFVKMSFAVLSKRRETHLPWIGRELQIGLVPVGILFLAWVVVVLCTRRENRRRPGAE